ncbi:MAG: site-specific integrase [Anaerolineales bacterium]|nr:site-specific integrase [Anaerolineales bacterium]
MQGTAGTVCAACHCHHPDPARHRHALERVTQLAHAQPRPGDRICQDLHKGSKERFVYLGKSTKRARWRYISLVRAEPVLGADNVFLSEDGRPIPQLYLANILAKVSKWGGVAKVHPHRFRRTAAIQFLRIGGNIFALQKLFGHETLDMIRHYMELTSDDVAVAHQQASPVDGWRL